jgi:hypothetical protein
MAVRSVHALLDILPQQMVAQLRQRVGSAIGDDWRTLSDERFKALYMRYCHAYRHEAPDLLAAYPFLCDAVKQHDRKIVDTPFEWQYWPLLPMALRGGERTDRFYNAVLFSDSRPIVYYQGMQEMVRLAHEFMAEEGRQPTWQDVLAKCSKREFSDMNTLIEVYTVDQ